LQKNQLLLISFSAENDAGKTVYLKVIQVDVSSLVSGVYTVKLTSGDGVCINSL
jgi:hypothetical protein